MWLQANALPIVLIKKAVLEEFYCSKDIPRLDDYCSHIYCTDGKVRIIISGTRTRTFENWFCFICCLFNMYSSIPAVSMSTIAILLLLLLLSKSSNLFASNSYNDHFLTSCRDSNSSINNATRRRNNHT